MGGDLHKIQKGCGVMNTKEISGKRQMEFLAGFDFVREAGTAGGSEGGEDYPETLDSFGVKNWMRSFLFGGFRINRAVLKVVEPYQKEVRGDRVWKMWKYWGRRSEADSLYVGR